MNLVSIVNSGESLIKTIVLAVTGYNSNKEFYDRFEKVYFVYGHNVRKKSNSLHGSVGFVSDNQMFLQIAQNRNKIIDFFVKKGLLEEHQTKALRNDENVFKKFVEKLPYEKLFIDLSKILINKIEEKYKKIRFIEANLSIDNLDMGFVYNHRAFVKFYFLTNDGQVGRMDCSGKNKNQIYHRLSQFARYSILSSNVYYFIKQIVDVAKSIPNTIIGYKEMKRYPRASYNYALEHFVKVNNCIIEPKNTIFGNYLNNNDFVDVRVDKAIWTAFKEICEYFKVII